MSLRLLQLVPSVPDDTARIARAAFPRGNPYVLLRNRLGPVFDDAGFADLYPQRGQPAYTPWRLALVTPLPLAEEIFRPVVTKMEVFDTRICVRLEFFTCRRMKIREAGATVG